MTTPTATTTTAATTTTRAALRTLPSVFPCWLAGKALLTPRTTPVWDKYTQEVATHVSLASQEDVHRAIEAAERTKDAMARLPAFQRKDILSQVATELRERLEEFATLLAIEAGKPIRDSRVEISRAIETFQIAAEESVRLYGEYVPLDMSSRTKGLQALVRRFPVGPVSMITPFNFPVNLAAHKIGPAIAAGCPFVMKPSVKTPITAMALGEVLSKTSLPLGAFSILNLGRSDASPLVEDDRMKMLSFTGSAPVGWKMKSMAGRKKVSLELGGTAACIVDRDADVEHVVQRILFGAFYQSGQSCVSVQNIFAHESLYEELAKRLKEETAKLTMGDPLDEQTFLGPLITEEDAQRVENWIEEAIQDGAKLLVGGRRHGVLMEGTILENVGRTTRLGSREVFGPVCCLSKFNDIKEVVQAVNESDCGLQAGIFTRDLHRAFFTFERCEVGGLVVNDIPSLRADAQPYGGVRNSGFGREGLRYAMEEMTERRVMLLKNVGSDEETI